MTVWVFGDSFVDIQPNRGNVWPLLIAQKLNQNLNCFGQGGSAIEYTYYQFNVNREYIKNNDVVIVALTDTNRRWFFKDKPANAVDIYQNTNDAYKYYALYLANNNEIIPTYLINFVENLEYLRKKLNCHIIVIPCFEVIDNIIKQGKADYPYINFSNGHLFDVSYKEFDLKFIQSYGLLKYARNDLRPNHMIKSNHIILADKIVNNIKNQEPIVFDTFVKYVLNEHNLTNKEYSINELYNAHLNEELWNFHQFG